ncbi:hypothetical protein Ddc_11357 [Ditylenchus destructor]|nr:hypothetical protein Ddc_11357 [Ditylenchus destructor]
MSKLDEQLALFEREVLSSAPETAPAKNGTTAKTQPTTNGGPDRLAFDQECSTSNEFVEVKSEINEDEPTRSGDVTIKDAQSAFKVLLVESSFNGEDCGPDRLAFDQECSTSNEFVEVKSEINEDEPTRSGDVTIKDAQSAFKVVRKFVEAKFDAPTVLRMCKDLDAVLANDT